MELTEHIIEHSALILIDALADFCYEMNTDQAKLTLVEIAGICGFTRELKKAIKVQT